MPQTDKVTMEMLETESPGSSRRRIYGWAIALFLIFGGMQMWWTLADDQPQGVDPGVHMRRSLAWTNAISLLPRHPGALRYMYFEQEFGPNGNVTYPPVFFLVVGFFHLFTDRLAALTGHEYMHYGVPLAATMTNLLFMWVLIVSVIKLGKAAGSLTAGVLAAALINMCGEVTYLEHAPLLDTGLIAGTAWAMWRLVLCDGFADRRGSIWFGIVLALAILVKPVVVGFILAPALWVWLSRRENLKNPRVWTNIILSAVVCTMIAGTWYFPHWRAVKANLDLNQGEAAFAEDNAMPWTWEGRLYLVHAMATMHLFLPLFGLFLVAVGVWLSRLVKPLRGLPARRRALVCGLVGLSILSVILLNRPWYIQRMMLALLPLGLAFWLSSRARFRVLSPSPLYPEERVGVRGERLVAHGDLDDRDSRDEPLTSAQRDARAIIPLWLFVGFYIMTFTMLNKHPRYITPLLPGAVLVVGCALMWMRRRWMRVAWVVAALVFMAPYYSTGMTGWPRASRTVGLALSRSAAPGGSSDSLAYLTLWGPGYIGGPHRDHWHVPEICSAMFREHPSASDKHPVRLAMVPYMDQFSRSAFDLYAAQRNLPLRVEEVGLWDPQPAAQGNEHVPADPLAGLKTPDGNDFDYLMISEQQAGAGYLVANWKKFVQLVEKNPDRFDFKPAYAGTLPDPDRTKIRVYRILPPTRPSATSTVPSP